MGAFSACGCINSLFHFCKFKKLLDLVRRPNPFVIFAYIIYNIVSGQEGIAREGLSLSVHVDT